MRERSLSITLNIWCYWIHVNVIHVVLFFFFSSMFRVFPEVLRRMFKKCFGKILSIFILFYFFTGNLMLLHFLLSWVVRCSLGCLVVWFFCSRFLGMMNLVKLPLIGGDPDQWVVGWFWVGRCSHLVSFFPPTVMLYFPSPGALLWSVAEGISLPWLEGTDWVERGLHIAVGSGCFHNATKQVVAPGFDSCRQFVSSIGCISTL